jgi:hypothetical protein
MIIVTTVKNVIQYIIQYIVEGFTRIFSPNDDQYPAVGIQPFSGIIE